MDTGNKLTGVAQCSQPLLICMPLSNLSRFHCDQGVKTRENREGRPLLTVETEVNGDSKSTNERGPSLVG